MYFVVDEDKFIKLLTFVWYSEVMCNVPQLTEVNRFSKLSRNWETETFSIEKFDNFRGCKIASGIFKTFPRFDYKSHDYTSTHFLKLHTKILHELSTHLNFNLTFITSDDPDDVDISIRTRLYNFILTDRIHVYFLTRPYLFESSQVAVPVGHEFTGYEKLLLPFEHSVWCWILVTFAVAFGTIFILRFTSVKVKNFIIGRSVATPTLNVVMIFVGTSVIQTPGRNFARFLLMTFILFSLIIRTAWQSKMFEFLQKDMKKPEVQSIDEIISKNFTFYLRKGFTAFYNMEILKR